MELPHSSSNMPQPHPSRKGGYSPGVSSTSDTYGFTPSSTPFYPDVAWEDSQDSAPRVSSPLSFKSTLSSFTTSLGAIPGKLCATIRNITLCDNALIVLCLGILVLGFLTSLYLVSHADQFGISNVTRVALVIYALVVSFAALIFFSMICCCCAEFDTNAERSRLTKDILRSIPCFTLGIILVIAVYYSVALPFSMLVSAR